MKIDELKEMFKNIKVGDVFSNIRIEGLNEVNTDRVLQELARQNNVQFNISTNYYNNKKNVNYEVIVPSKKFLNKEGQWSMSISKKVKDYLNEMEA